MNVLIENGSYHMDNMGDVAMLQVCVRRVRRRWPEARVRVLVQTPERLARACPGAEPLPPSIWHSLPVLPKLLRPRGGGLRAIDLRLPLHLPALAHRLKRRHGRHRAAVMERVEAYHQAVRDADAVICSGGGFINDWHADHADRVLQTLALAQGLGKPTAMFGAGLGPLTEPAVRALARPVLRRLRVLGLREEAANARELASLGVPPRRVRVTGDDAIEPAFAAAPAALGRGIGVAVRLAAHAEASLDQTRSLAPALRDAAKELAAPLVPTPVRNRHSPDNDVDALRAMFPDGGMDLAEAERVETPDDLIGLIGGCRVVVTGAYHAGVFALAQGIPVVALSGTAYYDAKFGGLREQFGGGVTLLRYDSADLPRSLRAAVAAAWETAPTLRASLREAARRQIDASRAAYDDFFAHLEHGAAQAAPTPPLERRAAL